MTVEFKALFDGPGLGLPENRLSISAFAGPLDLLLKALQRTASGIVAAAIDNPDYGVRGGRLAEDAKLLDLELVQVHDGCAEPRFVCTTRSVPGQQAMLGDSLAVQTVDRLTRDIEAEARGVMRNAAARRYLSSLPEGLTRQRYTASSDGKVLHVAEFGSATLASAPPLLGHLVQRRARIVGVSFEPKLVRLRIDGRATNFQADERLIELALENRHREVSVAVVEDGDRSRIVWLRPSTEQPGVRTLTETVAHLVSSWPETLRILAQ